MPVDNNETIQLHDGTILTPVHNKQIDIDNFNIDFNLCASMAQKQVLENLVSKPSIPNYKDTPVEKLDVMSQKLTESNLKLDKVNLELENQTKELQFIKNENKLLNSQLEIANITIERQSKEIEALRDSNDKLVRHNKKLDKENKFSTLKNIFIAVIGGLILLFVQNIGSISQDLLSLIKWLSKILSI